MSDLPTREAARNAVEDMAKMGMRIRVLAEVAEAYADGRLIDPNQYDWDAFADRLFGWALDRHENVSLPSGRELREVFDAAVGKDTT